MATMTGDIGDNSLDGTSNADTVLGLGGDDTIYGGDGADILYGESLTGGIAEPTALYTFDSLLLGEGLNSGTGGSDYNLLNLTLVDIATPGIIGPHGSGSLLGDGTGLLIGGNFFDTWPADAFATDGTGSFTMWAAYSEGTGSSADAPFNAIAAWGGVLQLGYRQSGGDWFLELHYTGIDGAQSLSAAIPDVNGGDWHNIGLTFDENDVATLYFDGVEVGQSASGFLDFNARDDGFEFRLSPFADGDPLEMTRLDDVGYWKGSVLSADEMAAIHTSGAEFGVGLDLAGALGSPGDDTITAGDGDDTVFGQDGNDLLYGGGDGDVIYGGNGLDSLDGGDGADVLYGAAGDDVIEGGLLNDSLDGGEGLDLLFGGGGNDSLIDAADAATVSGGTGNDYLGITQTTASAMDKLLAGDDGDDIIVLRMAGEQTQGRVHGDDGTDSGAGHGADEIYIAGSYGTMASSLGGGNDLFIGGGSDLDDLAGVATGARIDSVQGGAGNDRLAGWAGDDVLHGDDIANAIAGNDTLWGGAGGDTLFGGMGTDMLYGETGNDVVYGGAGGDWLHYYVGHAAGNGGDGDGTDQYFGGSGSDNLVLTSARDLVYGGLVTSIGLDQWDVTADTGNADGNAATDFMMNIYEDDGSTLQGLVFFTGGEFQALWVQTGLVNIGGSLVPIYNQFAWNGSDFA